MRNNTAKRPDVQVDLRLLNSTNPQQLGELFRESEDFRLGLIEGGKRGCEIGFKQGEIAAFNRCTAFLTETLEKMQAEGKTLAEAIEFINK